MTGAVFLTALALLAATPGDVDEPTVGLIVWSDSQSDEDADAAIARWKALRIGTTQPITKLISDTVMGLRPGIHVTVLGVCPVAESEKLVRRIHSIDKAKQSAYVRVVPLSSAIGRLSCPTITLPKQDWSIECDDQSHEVSREVKFAEHGYLLRVHATLTGSCTGEGETSSWSATATVEKRGHAVDTRDESAPDWAKIHALRVAGKSILLETDDNDGSCQSATMFDTKTVERRFTMAHGKLITTRRVLHENAGLCEPDMEGLSGCELAPKLARYNAVKDECTKSTAACTAALNAYDDEHKSDPAPDCGE